MKPWWMRKSGAENAAENTGEIDADSEGIDTDPVTLPKTKVKAKEVAPGNAEAHPVLTAALAAGISTAVQFADVLATAKAARADLQASCLKAAVRLFGAEQGPTKAESLLTASYADVKAMTALWDETADAKFGANKERPAQSQTAPIRRADDADGAGVAAAQQVAANAGKSAIDMDSIYASRKNAVKNGAFDS